MIHGQKNAKIYMLCLTEYHIV